MHKRFCLCSPFYILVWPIKLYFSVSFSLLNDFSDSYKRLGRSQNRNVPTKLSRSTCPSTGYHRLAAGLPLKMTPQFRPNASGIWRQRQVYDNCLLLAMHVICVDLTVVVLQQKFSILIGGCISIKYFQKCQLHLMNYCNILNSIIVRASMQLRGLTVSKTRRTVWQHNSSPWYFDSTFQNISISARTWHYFKTFHFSLKLTLLALTQLKMRRQIGRKTIRQPIHFVTVWINPETSHMSLCIHSTGLWPIKQHTQIYEVAVWLLKWAECAWQQPQTERNSIRRILIFPIMLVQLSPRTQGCIVTFRVQCLTKPIVRWVNSLFEFHAKRMF